MKYISIMTILLIAPAALHGGTIYVPDDHATIQEAINAASDGDTIVVRPGTYVENIDFLGKAIIVKSEMGPDVTAIDGGSPVDPDFGSVVIFQNGEEQDSVLDGFSLYNGTGTTFTFNALGGAICVTRASPTIMNNTIRDNRAANGGGIRLDQSSALIQNNTITWNSADYGGGVNAVGSSTPTIEGNDISFNTSRIYGGGIGYTDSSGQIVNNRITGNSVTDPSIYAYGGGISCYYFSTPLIAGNLIEGNSANGDGGGVSFMSYSYADLCNNIICNNSTAMNGGGISLSITTTDPVNITNNTILGNKADSGGGGISCNWDSANAVISNSILWNNKALMGNEAYVGIAISPSQIAFSYCDVKGGQSSVHLDPGCNLHWGDGMIDADPLFMDPGSDDYHILFDSPCRSAGSRHAPSLPEVDFEGDPRTGLFVFPDMGADEFHTHFYMTGRIAASESVKGNIVGWPNTSPVVLISGSKVLTEPMTTPYGDFWLAAPWEHRIHFNPIPSSGVRTFTRTIAASLPPGTQIPLQVLVGTELSNPVVAIFE